MQSDSLIIKEELQLVLITMYNYVPNNHVNLRRSAITGIATKRCLLTLNFISDYKLWDYLI